MFVSSLDEVFQYLQKEVAKIRELPSLADKKSKIARPRFIKVGVQVKSLCQCNIVVCASCGNI